MSHPADIRQKPDLLGGHDAHGKPDILALYDRYAPSLLGVITQIITDRAEAVKLLEKTFVNVQAEIDQFRSTRQPLFVWLLSMARTMAFKALHERKQLAMPVFQLTTTGTVLANPTSTVALPTGFNTASTDPRLKELLDAVLFKNCTPEEAANTIGIPAETARQQLRLAIQQLRAQATSK